MSAMELLTSVGGIVLTIVNLWLLFAVKSFKDEMTSLRMADSNLTEKVTAISVLVAGQYITRTEFQSSMKEQTHVILTRMEDITRRAPNCAAYVAGPETERRTVVRNAGDVR